MEIKLLLIGGAVAAGAVILSIFRKQILQLPATTGAIGEAFLAPFNAVFNFFGRWMEFGERWGLIGGYTPPSGNGGGGGTPTFMSPRQGVKRGTFRMVGMDGSDL